MAEEPRYWESHLTQKEGSFLFGVTVEHRFFMELMKRGYLVYAPLVDIKQVDCIATKDHIRLLQFQVKANSKDGKFALLKINPRNDYYFAFYCSKINTFWIISASELINLAEKDTVDKKTGIQRYRISLTFSRNKLPISKSEYEKFMNDNGFDRLK